MNSNISNKKIIYLGFKKSVHDVRFIKALSENFKVRQFFLEDNLNPNIFSTFSENDVIFFGPLDLKVLQIIESFPGHKIGICWAYEINELFLSNQELKLFNESLNFCDVIISDSLYLIEKLKSKHHFKGSIYQLYYGCENLFMRNSKVNKRTYGNNTIGVNRRWEALYNNELVFNVYLKLPQDNNIKLSFANDGSLLHDFKTKNSAQIQSHNIQFLGKLEMDDLEQFYLNNEIYISAALSDGISVSLLEAMASGCICVVSDFPSNLEVISDSYNGYVFKNNDPESLLNTIEKVIALSVDQRKFIANNARDFVGKNANWETNKSILSKIACDL